jgi:hypothetical protein
MRQAAFSALVLALSAACGSDALPVDAGDNSAPGADGGDFPPRTSTNAGPDADGGQSAGPGVDAGENAEPSNAGSAIDFDPDRVYVVGSIFEDGKAGLETTGRVVCDPTEPNVVMGSIPAEIVFGTGGVFYGQPVIKPGSHDLLYSSHGFGRLRVLKSDPFSLKAGGNPWNLADWELTESPEDNDPAVDTPLCDEITAFLLGPLDGALYYQCPGNYPGGPWYRNGDEAWDPCSHEEDPNPLRVSEEGAVLCNNSVVYQDTVHPITSAGEELPPDPGQGVLRAKPGGGFWGVVRSGATLQRWTISPEGAMTFDGTYAAFPPKTRMGDERRLDATGALYHLGWGEPREDGTADDIIVRLSADFGSAEVIYAGYTVDDPLCRISRVLLTGP